MFLSDEVGAAFNAFEAKVYSDEALGPKTKQLIALACSVMADCTPCIEYHYQEAVKAGAAREEIAGALAVCLSVSAGSKRAKYARTVSDLEHHSAGTA